MLLLLLLNFYQSVDRFLTIQECIPFTLVSVSRIALSLLVFNTYSRPLLNITIVDF